ncbi:MAG: hypothetical protein ACI9J4_001679 [Paraglaciecola sp.]|jgi:hypothetical protein
MMKKKTMIDFFKGVTAPVMLALLVYFEQWENVTAWIYLALHGTYGVLWVLKSRIFGDKQWEQPCRSIGKIKRYFSYTQNT